jgi:glyoxylase-like metal-dependent hydrolase (beta-lactamase superfamily II)
MNFNKFARTVAIAFVVVVAGIFGLSGAFAAAPMVKSQAPGYYRLMLGDFEITALSDGSVGLPVDKMLTDIEPGVVTRALADSYLTLPLDTSVNGYLINTGIKLILIDTGTATLYGPTLGKLVTNLKAAGYQPEQVDEIYITHMHIDHVGGLLAGNKRAFPNAIVRGDQHDADFFLSQANLDKAPAEAKLNFQGAMASLNPYIEAGKFKPFDGDTNLTAGIQAIAAPGHTPGHTVFLVESKGQKLLVLGDVINVGAVQLPYPSASILFDGDGKAAAAQRKKVLAEVAKQGYLVAAAHLSFPGLGHIRPAADGYVWIPVNYSSSP